MCKASKYLNETKKLVDEIKRDQELLLKALSKYDKELSALYHKVEHSNLNACEGYYVYKQWQTLLRKRRMVKMEKDRMQSLAFSLNIPMIDGNIDRATKNVNKIVNKNNEYMKDWDISFEDELVGVVN